VTTCHPTRSSVSAPQETPAIPNPPFRAGRWLQLDLRAYRLRNAWRVCRPQPSCAGGGAMSPPPAGR